MTAATGFSGSSLREDSLYTTTAHRQSVDPATGLGPPVAVAAARCSTTSGSGCNGTPSAASNDETALAGAGAHAAARCETAGNGHGGAEFAVVHASSCGGHVGDASGSHGRQRSAVAERSGIRNGPAEHSCMLTSILSARATGTATTTSPATEQPAILRRLQFWHIAASRRQRNHRTLQRVNKHNGYYSPTMEQQHQRLKALGAGRRTDRRQLFVDFEESLLDTIEATTDAADPALAQVVSGGGPTAAEASAGASNAGPIDELSAYMHELRMRELS